MNQHVGNIIVDKRIKERRSFSGEKTYPNHTLYGERRRTIIKAGRRQKHAGRKQKSGCACYRWNDGNPSFEKIY